MITKNITYPSITSDMMIIRIIVNTVNHGPINVIMCKLVVYWLTYTLYM